MALEDLEGGSVYIDALVSSNPVGGSDQVLTLDNHIRGIKNVLLNSFPNVNGAVNPTPAEFNILAGATLSTAELNTLDGITSTVAELNILDGVTATAAEINRLDGSLEEVRTNLEFYFGRLNGSTGAAVNAPSGWSTTRLSTGLYRITHNLGNVGGNYTVVCSTQGNNEGWCHASTLAENTFNIQVNSGSGFVDADFVCFVVCED